MQYSDSWFSRYRRLIVCLVILVVVVAGVVCFLPGLIAPWSRLNKEEQEIDLYSGRARYARYFLYYRLRQETRETPLSEAIGAEVRSNGDEQWELVNIFSPGLHHSPHFIYHGAFAQIECLRTLWESENMDEAARSKTAYQLLRVWREAGSYFAGYTYLNLLHEVLGSAQRQPRKQIHADAIPDDLAERSLAKHSQ